jgi:hypothetical protein
MRVLVFAVVLLSRPDDLMGVGQQTGQSFTCDCTDKHVFGLQGLCRVSLDVIVVVYFRFFVEREVD